MTRNPLFRVFAGIVGLSAGLVGPITSLVHGMQHGQTDTVAHHGDGHAAHADAVEHDHGEPGEAPASSSSAGDHSHARLEAGTTSRAATLPTPFIVTAAITWHQPVLPVSPAAAAFGLTSAAVVTATGPPPPIRAPPAI